MGRGRRRLRMRVDTTQEELADFARKLANDDAFRRRMAEDPEAVLEGDFNIQIPPGQLTRPIELPSKREMQDALGPAGLAEPEAIAFIAFVAFVAFLAE